MKEEEKKGEEGLARSEEVEGGDGSESSHEEEGRRRRGEVEVGPLAVWEQCRESLNMAFGLPEVDATDANLAYVRNYSRNLMQSRYYAFKGLIVEIMNDTSIASLTLFAYKD